MKSLLLGNGINIQFGGKAYTSEFIVKRIIYRAKLNSYEEVFGNILTGEEIIGVFKGLVGIANDVRNGLYDAYIKDEDSCMALVDFKKRYNSNISVLHEIMLEDWFFVLYMFFMKNHDLIENLNNATQGFERLILDAIYNGGEIQNLYQKMPKSVKKFLKGYDHIFTLNYDNNIEKLTGKQVYHLHGDFSVLADSENPKNIQGFFRAEEDHSAVVIEGMEHCYCNALLNYSGQLKYKVAKDSHQLIKESESFSERYENDLKFRESVNSYKTKYPYKYKMIMTKIEHPELPIATEYYFDKFESLEDELHILGMSPNNDNHIFDIIRKNPSLKTIFFYCFSESEKNYIEQHFSDKFECRSAQELWNKLGCKNKKYNCHYSIPTKIDRFVECFNELSGDSVSTDQILSEIQQIPQFQMDRLCALVKADLKSRNPDQNPMSEEELERSFASISYIALQEGILPSVLYLICILNFEKIK